MSRRALGIVLLIAAAVLFYMATNASHSFSDQVSNVFTGRFTERTTWMFGGAIAAGLLGAFVLIVGPSSRRRRSL